MPARQATAGFTLIEMLIAVGLLSVIALGLTKTLVAAGRARVVSEKWMQATQLAAAGIEQYRAGQGLGPVRIDGGLSRVGSITPWAGHLGLYRLEVTVSWNDGEPHEFHLATLARR